VTRVRDVASFVHFDLELAKAGSDPHRHGLRDHLLLAVSYECLKPRAGYFIQSGVHLRCISVAVYPKQEFDGCLRVFSAK